MAAATSGVAAVHGGGWCWQQLCVSFSLHPPHKSRRPETPVNGVFWLDKYQIAEILLQKKLTIQPCRTDSSHLDRGQNLTNLVIKYFQYETSRKRVETGRKEGKKK